MCEECGPVPPEIKEAFDNFEDALEKLQLAISDDDMPKGITVDWVLVVAENFIHAHNDSTATSYVNRLNQPLYRTKGLMHEVLDNINANDITRRIMHHP